MYAYRSKCYLTHQQFFKAKLNHTEPRLHFLIPAYNEAASIKDLLLRINEVCLSLNIPFNTLVIDDGSQDQTSNIAHECANTMPIKVIRNEPNKGLGFSIKRGLKLLADNCQADDLIITLDADLTQDPAYISRMLKALPKADIVIASRYRKGSKVEGLSIFRQALSIGASLFMLTFCPIPGVRDYSCGFRLYKAEVIQWAFRKYGDNFITETGFACMVEIARQLRPHARFTEIPFTLKYDAKRKPSEMKIIKTIKAYLRAIVSSKFKGIEKEA